MSYNAPLSGNMHSFVFSTRVAQLETLEAMALRLLPCHIQHRVDELCTLNVVYIDDGLKEDPVMTRVPELTCKRSKFVSSPRHTPPLGSEALEVRAKIQAVVRMILHGRDPWFPARGPRESYVSSNWRSKSPWCIRRKKR